MLLLVVESSASRELAQERMDSGTRRSGGVLQPPVSLPTAPPRSSKSRSSPQLRVLNRIVDAPVDWMPKPGLPAGGRAECRSGERPCPYVRCEWHLWLILGEDRPGNPRGEGTPRARDGRWIPTQVTPTPARTTLLPRWLEYPTPACCGADVAEAIARDDAHAIKRVAEAKALTRSTVHRLIADALGKLGTNDETRARLRELLSLQAIAPERFT